MEGLLFGRNLRKGSCNAPNYRIFCGPTRRPDRILTKTLNRLSQKGTYTAVVRLGILRTVSARRSLSFFLAGVVCLAIWQIWLTWRLMEQDRKLDLQRLEQVADLAVDQFERTLEDWYPALHEVKALPPSSVLRARFPADATFILVAPHSVSLYPAETSALSALSSRSLRSTRPRLRSCRETGVSRPRIRPRSRRAQGAR
jgi:hypothetical protein